MSITTKTRHPGIYARHASSCAADPCTCKPRYQVKVSITGESAQRSATLPTLAAAKAWQADARGAVADGRLAARSGLTIEAAWERLHGEMLRGEVRNRSREVYAPLTIESYERNMRRFVLPMLGHDRIGDVKHERVEDLVARLEQAGAAGSSIRNALMPLQVLYRQRFVRKVAPVDPTEGVELPLRRTREGVVVSPEAAADLVAGIADSRVRVFWSLVLFAGLRRGEALALAWTDLNLDESPAGLRVSVSKTRAGTGRWVPILPIVRDAIMRRRNDSSVAVGERIVGLTPTGIRKASVRAGIDLVPHDGRKTFASVLAAGGLDGETISRVMGHERYETTREHYLRVLPGERERVASAVGHAFTAERSR